ncbi:MAG: FkbM family methyltransferase [Elusimicrobiota bacterium]
MANDPLADKRRRYLALAADLPETCRLIDVSEGNALARKFKKLRLFRGRYLRWAAAHLGLPAPKEVDVSLFWGGRMRLPYSDDSDFVTMYLAGIVSGPEYKLVRRFIKTLRPDDAFYDVGANYGFYTHLAAEFIGAGGEIHAFEPLPEVCAQLRRNSPGNAIRVVEAALWDSTGEAALYRSDLGDVCNTLEAEVVAFNPSHGSRMTSVRCVTLDDYARSQRPPTVIKIDVEGGERRLIAGGLDTLRRHRPALAMEVWSGPAGERFSLPASRTLLDLGYAAYTLDEDGGLSSLGAGELADFIAGLPGVWDNLVFLPA